MKKLNLLCLAVLLQFSVAASAYDVEIDGIYYDVVVKARQATVTYYELYNNNYTGDVVIPSTIEYDGVTCDVVAIGNSAFSDCGSVTSVSVPASVKTIGGYAFSGCSSLKTVNIPDGVETIEGYLFSGCKSLKSVSIPSSVKSLGGYAFDCCTSLEAIEIPASVSSIGTYCFSGCSSLVRLAIPYGVTRIEYATFKDCSSLESIEIPNSVTVIGNSSFDGCGLLSIEIPNSVTTIGTYVFTRCSKLASITLGTGLTSVGSFTFRTCTALTTVYISDLAAWCGIKFSDGGCPLEIAQKLVLNGTEIEDIVIPEGVTSIGTYAFYHFTGLKSVALPSSLTKIGSNAFDGCSGLTQVYLPNSVTSVGTSAFRNCNLKNIVIGTGMESISSWAFGNNKELTDVYCLAESVPSTASGTFDGSYVEYATLHVQGKCIDLYRAADVWKNFGTIVAVDEDEPETQCAKPAISYKDGRIDFACDTEGAEVRYTISSSGSGLSAVLPTSYVVEAYATKDGLADSEVATLTISVPRGDVNGDGQVNVSDAVGVVNIIMGQ